MENSVIQKVLVQIERIGNKWWGMLIIVMVFIFLNLSPFLVGGQVFQSSDTRNYVYPVDTFYKEAITTSKSILIDPYSGSGTPHFMSIEGGFFFPLNYFLFRFLPVTTAYHFLIFFYITLATFFVTQLLKEFGVSFWGCLIGSLAYIFSQWHNIHDSTIMSGAFFLPLLFLILLAARKVRIWPILAGGLVVGWMWLVSHYNITWIVLGGGFIFSLFLAWQEKSGIWKKWIRIPGKFLLMVSIGTTIGLIKILPLWLNLSLSYRAGGLSYADAKLGEMSLLELIRYLLPYFKPPFFVNQWGWEPLYLGVLPLFFLIFALTFFFKTSITRFFSFLFLGFLIVGTKYSPLFWLIHQLPVYRYFRDPSRWMVICSLGASFLIGFGVDKFSQIKKGEWPKIILRVFKWMAIMVATATIISNFIFYFIGNQVLFVIYNYFDQNIYPQTTKLPIEHYHRIISNYFLDLKSIFDLANPKFLLPFIFLILGYLILKLFYQNKIKPVYFLPLVGLFTALNLAFVYNLHQVVVSRELFFREPKTVSFLKDHPGRIFSFMPGFTWWSEFSTDRQLTKDESFILESELLFPNTNIFYKLESADVSDYLMSGRMADLLGLVGSEFVPGRDLLNNERISPREKIKLFEERKPILDFLGIKYIIIALSLDENKFTKVFQAEVLSGITINIYENKEAKPLFYLADSVKAIKPIEKIDTKDLVKLFEQNSIFIECDNNCPAVKDFDGQGEVNLLTKKNTSFLIETKTQKPQLLILSQNDIPGWKAYINNQEVPIYRVGTVYIGVVIPPGQNQVSFNYSYLNFFDLLTAKISSIF